MKRFFLNQLDNEFIVLFFLWIMYIHIIIIFFGVKLANTFSAAISLGLLSIPTIFLHTLKKYKSFKETARHDSNDYDKKNVFAGIINYKDVDSKDFAKDKLLIDRNDHVSSIIKMIDTLFEDNKNQIKGMVLTGESGAGKSILIHQIKEELSHCNDRYDIIIQREEYNNIHLHSCKDKKQIIFLDHFEKALNYKDYIELIKGHVKENNCVLVFSFPQNFLSRIRHFLIKAFGETAVQYTYVLYPTETDKRQYMERISRLVACELSEIKECVEHIEKAELVASEGNIKEIMCEELVKVFDGNAPLIELELLGYIYNNDFGNTKSLTSSDSFINIYLDSWVEKFEHKETAYAILFLLADSNTYTIDDIKLLTFESESQFLTKASENELNTLNGNITKLLMENPFLHSSIGENRVLSFELIHDYIIEKMRNYCEGKNISECISAYIDYLRKCLHGYKHKNEKYTELYNNIKNNYIMYNKKNICFFVIICIMSLGVTIVNLMNINCSVERHIQYAVNSIICMPSIYYIYNYCVRFIKMKNSMYMWVTCVVGVAVIVLSYLFINAWGICLGIEIITLSICIYKILYKSTAQPAKGKFLHDSIVFGCIGIMIVILGIIFLNIFSEQNTEMPGIWYMILKYSYYVQFFIYAVLSIVAHINYSYIIGRIGLKCTQCCRQTVLCRQNQV